MALAPSALSQLLYSNASEEAKTNLDIEPQILSRTIKKALEKGGDFAEVYIEHRISRAILLEESKFKSAVFHISQGAGVRVLSGIKTGYAYTEIIDEASLLKAAETASFIAQGAKKIKPVAIKPSKRKSFVKVKVPLETVADAKRMDAMQRAHQAALDYDKKITMVSVTYRDHERKRLIANSEGLFIKDGLPIIYFIVQALAVGEDTQHMGMERVSKRAGFEQLDEVKPEEVARAAAREAVTLLDAKETPAGKMDVVLQNGWGGVLVHEAVGHPLEADNIAKEIGAFTGKMGKKVASDIFTMIDDGTIINARGTTSFDDEGTQMKRNVLIENGVLVKFITDILSARQLTLERTGNGRRQDYRYMPIPRMTNTFIAAGKDKPEDILASTPKGLYVQSLSGGSVNPITGTFNFTCREAYLIEDGKKTYPVKGATLIGSCMEIISNVDAVGNDLDYGPGTCGKSSQYVEVTAGQPTVRIRNINVGGTKG
ncbi:MAG: hypothetical protein A2Y62_18185 [Candidatus Fischerbacteria bacterium RBG_13_37_8]|uniref:Peptidase C69 n=1 Tax=Candidatus Fischerbacteria bacterium RBG_13_37_8 TaxID=1817863 RepID=A0A1F5VVF9_9BACT|nr:MAG: hypothetical protein A2Y62_18185 [Candidatus Fischerbacteria bacterium RBG_13_37_8]